ncbi:MAG: family 16 glycoside hydrolase [Terriglobia bacterium]
MRCLRNTPSFLSNRIPWRPLVLGLVVWIGCSGVGPIQVLSGPGWEAIYDGKSLSGWKAPDMSVWSVEDGAITGTVTAERRPQENVFIVWQGGTVEDFELKFHFRMFGEKANSGDVKSRSRMAERGLVHGYQADITKAGKSLGGVWG